VKRLMFDRLSWFEILRENHFNSYEILREDYLSLLEILREDRLCLFDPRGRIEFVQCPKRGSSVRYRH